MLANWVPAPPKVRWADNEVHVWLTTLELPGDQVGRMETLLSLDEREKAARFHFEKDRRHYIAGRGFLRSLLGEYLAADPARLEFVCNSYGKPSLASSPTPTLRFNLSHSRGLALCAVAHERDVGIDLEYIRPDFATDEIAERFFAPAEVAALRSLAPEQQPRAFFDCWTRKEAYIKARGDGLFRLLNSFTVAFAPDEPPAILHAEDDPQASVRWSVHALDAPDGFAAALVVEQPVAQIQCWRWPSGRAD